MTNIDKIDNILLDHQKIVEKIILFLIFTFLILRFFNILADAPAKEMLITKSNPFLSDEGWWLNNTIHKIITGNWYIEGGYNPGVILPVVPFIQYIVFSIFGMGIATARVTAIIFFILACFLIYLIINKYTDKISSLVIIALIVQNYYLFIYSRFGFLFSFLVFFTLLPIYISTIYNKNDYLILGVSSFLVVIACLTKTTAIFVLPIILYQAFTRNDSPRKKILLVGWVIAIFTVLFGGYQLFINSHFPQDIEVFNRANIGKKKITQIVHYLYNFPEVLNNFEKISTWIYPIAIILPISFLIIYRKFRNDKLVIISLIWIISYGGLLLTVEKYHTRYYLIFLFPLIILLIKQTVYLFQNKNNILKNKLTVLSLIVLLSTIYNGSKVYSYFKNSEYSWINKINTIEKHISKSSDAILLSYVGSTISLETGIRSRIPPGGKGVYMTTKDLSWILENIKPDYYYGDISYRNVPIQDTLKKKYEVEKLKQFENRSMLFKLNQK